MGSEEAEELTPFTAIEAKTGFPRCTHIIKRQLFESPKEYPPASRVSTLSLVSFALHGPLRGQRWADGAPIARRRFEEALARSRHA